MESRREAETAKLNKNSSPQSKVNYRASPEKRKIAKLQAHLKSAGSITNEEEDEEIEISPSGSVLRASENPYNKFERILEANAELSNVKSPTSRTQKVHFCDDVITFNHSPSSSDDSEEDEDLENYSIEGMGEKLATKLLIVSLLPSPQNSEDLPSNDSEMEDSCSNCNFRDEESKGRSNCGERADDSKYIDEKPREISPSTLGSCNELAKIASTSTAMREAFKQTPRQLTRTLSLSRDPDSEESSSNQEDEGGGRATVEEVKEKHVHVYAELVPKEEDIEEEDVEEEVKEVLAAEYEEGCGGDWRKSTPTPPSSKEEEESSSEEDEGSIGAAGSRPPSPIQGESISVGREISLNKIFDKDVTFHHSASDRETVNIRVTRKSGRTRKSRMGEEVRAFRPNFHSRIKERSRVGWLEKGRGRCSGTCSECRPTTATSSRKLCSPAWKPDQLPQYNGFRSEYGLSEEQLKERKRMKVERAKCLKMKKIQKNREEEQRRYENNLIFSSWLEKKRKETNQKAVSRNRHVQSFDIKTLPAPTSHLEKTGALRIKELKDQRFLKDALFR